ncbi:hypothetical protein NDU88_006514 [Pleurodeles waltl]|uniref:Uncharacterized protein n=1 Tax=Pleurodeles waltl TaxID=8319 RepID=A0AAV7WXU3_PLEWA|nr:hypothetical protein NDU88_006514 [Pleurodeles waltl]
MDTKISAPMDETKSICTDIANFQNSVEGMERMLMSVEDHLNKVSDRDREFLYLWDKIMDLEDRSLRDNQGKQCSDLLPDFFRLTVLLSEELLEEERLCLLPFFFRLLLSSSESDEYRPIIAAAQRAVQRGSTAGSSLSERPQQRNPRVGIVRTNETNDSGAHSLPGCEVPGFQRRLCTVEKQREELAPRQEKRKHRNLTYFKIKAPTV